MRPDFRCPNKGSTRPPRSISAFRIVLNAYSPVPRGERLVAKVPRGHWKATTFASYFRHDRIEAPCLLDGPINAEAFTTKVENVLVPTLRRASW